MGTTGNENTSHVQIPLLRAWVSSQQDSWNSNLRRTAGRRFPGTGARTLSLSFPGVASCAAIWDFTVARAMILVVPLVERMSWCMPRCCASSLVPPPSSPLKDGARHRWASSRAGSAKEALSLAATPDLTDCLSLLSRRCLRSSVTALTEFSATCASTNNSAVP